MWTANWSLNIWQFFLTQTGKYDNEKPNAREIISERNLRKSKQNAKKQETLVRNKENNAELIYDMLDNLTTNEEETGKQQRDTENTKDRASKQGGSLKEKW